MTASLGFIESDECSQEGIAQCEFMNLRDYLSRDHFESPTA